MVASFWTFLFTRGDLDIYKYKSLRIAIDRKTGEQILGYVMGGESDN